MTNLHRILVPVDFSDASKFAARYAGALIHEGRGELHLLHVLAPRPMEFALIDPPPSRRRIDAAARTEESLANLWSVRAAIDGRIDVRLRAAEGDPAGEIVRYAAEQHMDAVVMPTRARDGLDRLLMVGSVTMKVLHALDRPVITGVDFESHQPPESVDRILCAVDLGPATERVLCAGLRAARRFRAALSVAHAHPPSEFYDDDWRQTVIERAHRKLEELVERLGVEADVRVKLEKPPRAISSLALELGANLVVIGRSVSDGLLGRLRADAHEIIRLCHCPVASV
jgi:nucleotide-binding universal stress UspA family protein